MNIELTIEEAKANGVFNRFIRFAERLIEFNEKNHNEKFLLLQLESQIQIYDYNSKKVVFGIAFKKVEVKKTDRETRFQVAFKSLRVEFSELSDGVTHYNVSVNGSHTNAIIKRALCKQIELEDKSETIYSSRVMNSKNQVEVLTSKGRKLFAIHYTK